MTSAETRMHVIRDPLGAPVAQLPRGAIATIGNFDGVHRGHQRILRRVVERARAVGRPAVAITFEPHPLAVLRPDQAPPRLQTLRQKEEAMEAIGLDTLLVIPFTRDFSLTEPEEFVGDFLGARLAASEIFLGRHFAFGRGKRGDLSLLARLGPESGFEASAVEEVEFEGEPISSTRIREAIRAGEVARAAQMLGRDYEMDGIVTKGEGMGRKIGYPTINLSPENELYPGNGVYVSRLAVPSSGTVLDAVTNVGTRPTLYEDVARTIETYVPDFSGDVYGEKVRLFFRERLREERKFASLEDLTAQIGRDVDDARAYFKAGAGD